MKLKEIEFEYVLCFGPKNKIKFNEEFNILIRGKWQNQPERSNWSGKSSFLEVISLLAYGQCRASVNEEIPNDNFDKDGIVSGVIEANNQEFHIKRIFSGKTSSLEVEEWKSFKLDKIEIQKRLDDLFGYNYKDFTRTCFFTQGEIHQFMESRNADKLEMLNNWMEISSWDKYLTESKNRMSELRNLLQKNQEKIIKYDETINLLSIAEKELDEEDEKILKLKNKDKKLKEKQEEYNLLIHDTDIKLKEIEANLQNENNKMSSYGSLPNLAEELISDKEKEAEKLEQQINKINSEIKNFEKIVENLNAFQDKKNSISVNLTDVSGKKYSLKNSLEIFNSDGCCPLDKEKCSKAEGYANKAKKIQKELEELEKEEEELQQSFNKFKMKCSAYELELEEIGRDKNRKELLEEKFKTAKEKVKELKAKEKDIEKTREMIFYLKNSRSELIKNKDYINASNELKSIETEIENITQSINEAQYNRGTIASEVKHLKIFLKEIEEAKKDIDKQNKRKEILHFCSYMFSREGIRAAQLRNRIEQIELETNQILEGLNSELSIQISTEKELQGYENFCQICGTEFEKGSNKCSKCKAQRQRKKKEEFEIKVINRGRIRSFSQESGGAKIIISLAIRLSIIKIRKMITGFSMQLLALDEIYGMLDKPNRNEIYQFLLAYANDILGFKQIFQITHITDSNISGEVIEIIKKNKYSEVNYE